MVPPPDLRVFVSATCKDLEDCRPGVIKAVKGAGGLPVTMEEWDADYQDPLELCLVKLQESTNYIGLFGYYRGWVIEALHKSITEAEYEAALARLGPVRSMAVLVPKETSPFAATLLARARALLHDQDPSELDAALDAQQAFLRKVLAKGTVEQFIDMDDLLIRVTRKVTRWALGPVRTFASNDGGTAGVPRPARPEERDLDTLGRRAHVQAFEEALDAMEVPGTLQALCVLIPGPRGFGHDYVLNRLEQVVGQGTSSVRRVRVSMGVRWRDTGASGLVGALGTEFSAAAATVGDLARLMSNWLASCDVLAIVRSLQRYDGGVSGFVEEVWEPLVREVGKDKNGRLLLLASVEGTEMPALRDAPGLRILPVLGAFSLTDIKVWLRRWVPSDQVSGLAQDLLSETHGDPRATFAILLDEATWQSGEGE